MENAESKTRGYHYPESEGTLPKRYYQHRITEFSYNYFSDPRNNGIERERKFAAIIIFETGSEPDDAEHGPIFIQEMERMNH